MSGMKKWLIGFVLAGILFCTSLAVAVVTYAGTPGTLKWKFKTGNYVYSSPAIGTDGTVYVGGSYDHYLYAINSNGTLKWKFLTGNIVKSSPAIGSDGTVYVGSNDHYILSQAHTL
jgi:outer membrane protein assembly factor BamB